MHEKIWSLSSHVCPKQTETLQNIKHWPNSRNNLKQRRFQGVSSPKRIYMQTKTGDLSVVRTFSYRQQKTTSKFNTNPTNHQTKKHLQYSLVLYFNIYLQRHQGVKKVPLNIGLLVFISRILLKPRRLRRRGRGDVMAEKLVLSVVLNEENLVLAFWAVCFSVFLLCSVLVVVVILVCFVLGRKMKTLLMFKGGARL